MNKNKKKILVCDDDEGILGVLTVILENEGFLVKVVSQGRGILKRIKEFKPELIILDIMMPGVDGKEITKILKREKETSKIPLIILTALNDPGKIAKELGADDFLAKPFDIVELTTKIKHHLN